ncbi:tetratricopeptide repeat protein [Altererythrobacter sp.]|uniref:tetratricopeptide repeat protein n=1 Tax=Altererythrobacter sp. TaxID=1872480 RepID=UPI003D09F199
MSSRIPRILAPALAACVVLSTPVPALAQDGTSEARLRKIEAEVRALQRKVFPGGDERFFTPEISAGGQTASGPSTPSSTAVTDILARLDAIETQLQRLTARSEENTNAIAGIETRLTALEPKPEVVPEPPVEDTPPSAAETNLSAMTGGASEAVKEVPTKPVSQPAGPSAERLAAVQAIAKPQTDDPADDEYSYGYRLWKAGFYPEAEQQLSLFVEKYPSHWRITYGRNLLGRAYLDDGKPREAAPWFLRNYQTDKQGARAGDSLLYLAEAMIALEDTNRACIALAEFSETYPALAAGRLQDQYEANRQKVRCN